MQRWMGTPKGEGEEGEKTDAKLNARREIFIIYTNIADARICCSAQLAPLSEVQSTRYSFH